jgi:N-acetylglucosamine kinase-like BadF-type ATPase
MRYVVGVDGGATKTHALVIEETGRALGLGERGPSNYHICGLKTAVGEIEQAAREALDEAHIAPDAVAMGYFCLAGADLPEDFATLTEALSAAGVSQEVIVKNDTMAALRAGLTRSWGVVVICGTGFNAAGRGPDGREVGLPGLGVISGDWGGGGELSQEVIRAVMRAWDGRGKPTLLTTLVLEALDAPSEEDLLMRLHHEEIKDRDLHILVPILFEAAAAGDEVAGELIILMATEVGITANTLIRRLSLEKEDVEVALGGSVFKGKGPLLLDTIIQVIHKKVPRARIVLPRYEPVCGAALLALESIGVPVTEKVYSVLDTTLPDRLKVSREEIGGEG